VLDALVASASQEADRAGVLLIRGGRVHGWRLSGFAPSFEASAIDIGLNDAGIIAIAVEQQRAASSDSDGPAPPFAELGDRADSTEAIAVPIVLAGEVVAVLYVDQPDAEPGILTLEPATLEVLARHAARALEALTAFKAVRSITGADAASADAGADGANNGGSQGSAADDEDESARRYARLVISEIKLYHEDAVAEGRRDRNLAARLGGEIARARALYEQRVPAHLRGAAEHFHAELVRTLAGGDASLFEKASLS
jgi:GAF domain-containing protein